MLGSRGKEVRRLLRRLTQMGRLIEVAHDHFFTRDRVIELAAAIRLLAERSQNGKITAAAFRDRIGTGRKLAIPILEFFDPNRHDYSRGEPAEPPGGPTRVIKRRRLLKEDMPCGRRRPPERRRALEIKFPLPTCAGIISASC